MNKIRRLIKGACLLLTTTLLLTACQKSSETTNAAVDGDLTLKENQTLVIGQITAINGNEITLALATEMTRSSANTNNSNESSSDTNQRPNSDSSQRPSRGGSSTENQSQGDSTVTDTQPPSREMPSTTQESGDNNMPSDMQAPTDNPTSSSEKTTSASGKSDSNDSATKSENQKQSRVMYTLTGEEQNMLIPVGTPVTTLLGTVSTFSRIAVNNTVKIVTQTSDNDEEVIVAVYIVG